jgi:intracellular septation protein
MKLLFDFLPIILFFATFKYAESHKAWAAAFATEYFGLVVSGGLVGPDEAPVLLATVVVMVATLAQIAFTLARGKRVDTMLWVTFVLVVGLGGATIWFHNPTFIKWKPSVLYWAMAIGLWASQTLFRKNLLQTLMGDKISLPPAVWLRLNWAWVGFFLSLGVLNLYIAYNMSTSAWATFKVFGATGLMLAFMLAQGVYISRHVQPEPEALPSAPKPAPKTGAS